MYDASDLLVCTNAYDMIAQLVFACAATRSVTVVLLANGQAHAIRRRRIATASRGPYTAAW